jgi:hypothetical protein
VTCIFPLCMPLGFVFDPGGNQRLLDLKIWIAGCKMPCRDRLVFAILIAPVKNFDPLLKGGNLFLRENWSGFDRLFFRFLGWSSYSEPSQCVSVSNALWNTNFRTFLFVSCHLTSCPLPQLLYDILPILVQPFNSSFIV